MLFHMISSNQNLIEAGTVLKAKIANHVQTREYDNVRNFRCIFSGRLLVQRPATGSRRSEARFLSLSFQREILMFENEPARPKICFDIPHATLSFFFIDVLMNHLAATANEIRYVVIMHVSCMIGKPILISRNAIGK